MSLPDTAEYWWDVKKRTTSFKKVFTHLPNVDCGHFHVHEAKHLDEVDCYACLKMLKNGIQPDDTKLMNKVEQLQRRTADILVLEQEFTVEKLTDFHYRIDNFLDLYPVKKKYHNIITQDRGIYPNGDIEPFIWVQKDTFQSCSCGGNLVVRKNKANGNKFLGCTNYPKCTKTKSI